jgi:hypothetical protein
MSKTLGTFNTQSSTLQLKKSVDIKKAKKQHGKQEKGFRSISTIHGAIASHGGGETQSTLFAMNGAHDRYGTAEGTSARFGNGNDTTKLNDYQTV